MRYLGGKIVEMWDREDVREAAKQINFTLDEAEIETVLFYTANDFDASIGCNWDVIKSNIKRVKRTGARSETYLKARIDSSDLLHSPLGRDSNIT